MEAPVIMPRFTVTHRLFHLLAGPVLKVGIIVTLLGVRVAELY